LSEPDFIEFELLSQGFAPVHAAALALYGALVLEANRVTNLTAARTPAALLDHIVDSLTLSGDVDGPLIDLGSGAGFPGIPLAIVTGQPVTLVESVRKKAMFLGGALKALNVLGEVIDGRAERLGSDPAFRERFSSATARAVASAPTVAELAVPFLAIGGKALLQRGALDERERRAVVDAAPMLGAKLVEERLIAGERRILVLQKVSSTPARFPRRDGIPEKRPLCF
jgi:16S rRNA (guanine527-N7)-methyltransferase